MSTRFLPEVIHAEYRGEYRIHVTFSDRLAATIDFAGWLVGPVRRFFLDGGTVVWPNGADMAPETVFKEARTT